VIDVIRPRLKMLATRRTKVNTSRLSFRHCFCVKSIIYSDKRQRHTRTREDSDRNVNKERGLRAGQASDWKRVKLAVVVVVVVEVVMRKVWVWVTIHAFVCGRVRTCSPRASGKLANHLQNETRPARRAPRLIPGRDRSCSTARPIVARK
jgi:hypothetical protein